MSRGRLQVFVLVSAILSVCGCSTVPLRNEPLEHPCPDGGYRFANVPPGEHNSDSLLVVLTFSGGGTRAAALCYGVLEKLRDTEIVWEGQRRRLLDEVDAISSVSGGSLPAAYYGLFGERIFEEFPEKVLYRDIQGNLIKSILAVRNYVKLASPFYGRTDLMADDFSHNIFDGKDFDDLMAKKHRPFLIINATDVSLGRRFDFTQRQFDLLNSNLGPYPIGNAVAASAAFPGLLTPITLRNFDKGRAYQAPTWIDEELARPDIDRPRYRLALEAQSYIEPGRPYVHLSDGGVSDNLGIMPIIQLLEGTIPNDSMQVMLSEGVVRKVIIITVNAKRRERNSWDTQANSLNVLKVLGVASSVPLGNFSESQVAYLKLFLGELEEKQRLKKQLAETLGPEAVAEKYPSLNGPDVDFRFVEVEFNRIEDEAERDYLNAIPTAFRLKREQVDHLRRAAGTILDAHPDFQAVLQDLR